MRVEFRAHGVVQGVGFRPTVQRRARSLGLVGWVANDASGLCGEAEGPAGAVAALVRSLEAEPPPAARVERVEAAAIPLAGGVGFAIERTRAGARPTLAVPADLATCAACLAEVLDRADRRAGHAFASCTGCGPRLSISVRPPFDRATTTMASFELCPACAAEYADPTDRRFHAQTTCCPACGPTLALATADDVTAGRSEADGAGRRDAPVEAAAALLRAGGVVAVKGLGGYHLACRADDEAAVRRVRHAKRREAQPLAVLAADLEAAQQLCQLTPEEEALLTGPRGPIVLAPRQSTAAIAPAVAPGTDLLGVLLPATPLHHLLARAVGQPLVLTSANPTGDPMIVDDDAALALLPDAVDAVLAHDRPIAVRVDDSVVRTVGGAPQLIRRARGWAPEPIRLASPVPAPILAVGGDLKATACVAVGDRAWLSTHLGDLAHPDARDAHRHATEQLLAMTGAEPVVVAHDLHPTYASTALAERLADDLGAALAPVQHHHAHVASVVAEHGHLGPIVGLALDGAGHGLDGSTWGGELLLVDGASLQRLGHLAPVALPGGDAAAREPWRMAAAHLVALGARTDGIDLVGRHPDRWDDVARLAATPGASPRTTSTGRLFDAVAALCGVADRTSFEAQAAIGLERLAAPVAPAPADSVGWDEVEGAWVLRSGALVAEVVEGLRGGRAPAEVAARFHDRLAAVAADSAASAAERHGIGCVALSGGSFQNDRLLTATAGHLVARGLRVLTNRQVPTNDGGLSLGQVHVAAADLRPW